MLEYPYGWFFIKIAKYIADLDKLLKQIINSFMAISIGFSRLFLLLLKRMVCIVKNWLKENKIEEWLKSILHGAYLTVFEDLYLFLYVLHFFRAFLTLIDYFSDQDNKNLVEVTKFFYALFKVFISLLMLSFMLILMVHGLAPLSTMPYQIIKLLFRTYTFSKFAINLISLGFSYYQLRTHNEDADHNWLRANYRANLKKNFEILVVAIPITVLLTLVSFGIASGPWFWIMVGLASLFLIVDMAKAIYYYINPYKIPEPRVGSLSQKNSFFDVSEKNFYYIKGRSGSLLENKTDDNRIYLLKEILVKIMQLEGKLANHSVSSFGFFSENKKIEKKIEGLQCLASSLLTEEKKDEIYSKLQYALRDDAVEALNGDRLLLLPKEKIRNLTHPSQTNSSSNVSDLETLLNPSKNNKKKIDLGELKQPFEQSFFKKLGDCGELYKACQRFDELRKSEKKTSELGKDEKSPFKNQPGCPRLA